MKWKNSSCNFWCAYAPKCPLGMKPLEMTLQDVGTINCEQLLDLREALLEVHKREKEQKEKEQKC